MRVGRPDELRVQAFPVLTARISETELAKWFPVPFHYLTDPQETPEPSKAALIRLDQGEYFVLYWGELSKQLKLEIPAATDPSGFLDAFFREVPLPRGRILWRRQGTRLPRHVAAKTVSAGSKAKSASQPRSTKNDAGGKKPKRRLTSRSGQTD